LNAVFNVNFNENLFPLGRTILVVLLILCYVIVLMPNGFDLIVGTKIILIF